MRKHEPTTWSADSLPPDLKGKWDKMSTRIQDQLQFEAKHGSKSLADLFSNGTVEFIETNMPIWLAEAEAK